MNLNSRIKEDIVEKVIEHKYTNEVTSFVKDKAKLNEKIYNAIYSSRERKRMRAYPHGYLPHSTIIYLERYRFNPAWADSDIHQFNQTKSMPIHIRIENEGYFPIPYMHMNRTIDTPNLVLLDIEDMRNRELDITTRILRTKGEMHRIVNQFRTVQSLIKCAPELARFVPEISESEPTIDGPDLRSKINQILGVKKE